MNRYQSRLTLLPCLTLVAVMLCAAPTLSAQTAPTQAQTSAQTVTVNNPSATVVPDSQLAPPDSATSTEAVSATPLVTASSNTQPLSESTDEPLAFMHDAGSESSRAATPSTFGLLARTAGALLLILGLIAAVGYGVKRFGGTRLVQTQADAPQLSVLASLSLGERRTLSVVRFGERTLLVGATAQSVVLLCEQEDIDPLSNLVISPQPHRRSVGELLQTTDGGPNSFNEELFRADQHRAQSGAMSSMSSWAKEGI